MPLGVMRVIEREVLRPAWARFCQFKDGLEKRRIISPHFQLRHVNLRALRQLRLGRQHYHAVLDCAFEARAYLITRIHC